ncbi:hypothetical protein M433DRAFT_380367 [Acidomyces richmondensis BFW]|nr:MAG: hypothetical protein FE78DRAFT_321667 [Acidomyces sp. 'richmondensis']KYG48831.1 hypothetical protein M433DRAFT_380367 [Acidomyces richmondensis BFW]
MCVHFFRDHYKKWAFFHLPITPLSVENASPPSLPPRDAVPQQQNNRSPCPCERVRRQYAPSPPIGIRYFDLLYHQVSSGIISGEAGAENTAPSHPASLASPIRRCHVVQASPSGLHYRKMIRYVLILCARSVRMLQVQVHGQMLPPESAPARLKRWQKGSLVCGGNKKRSESANPPPFNRPPPPSLSICRCRCRRW